MFTGIVEKSVRVIGVADGPKFRRLTIVNEWNDLGGGESIAINGVCLTVAELMGDEIGFDVIAETLSKTNLGLLKGGDSVNVERALCIGDRIDGHFVQGHVDGTARLVDVRDSREETRLTLEPPADLAKYIIPKGSVTLDGVSLTIAAMQGSTFQVALIPTTLARTNMGTRPAGWPFNLETDVLAKTIVSWLERTRPTTNDLR